MKIGEETIICANVYEWIKSKTDLSKHYFHFANEGKRGYVNASILLKMGFKSGVVDIFISKSNEKYKGLWIEAKSKGKKPTPEQICFMSTMTENGYFCAWFDNYHDIIRCIKTFYSLN